MKAFWQADYSQKEIALERCVKLELYIVTSKIGRNGPCSCGSGLTYKKCCANKQSSNVTVLDFAWNSLRKTEGSVIDKHLLPYITRELPSVAMQVAHEDFCLEDFPEEMDLNLLCENFFIPWLLFDWIPYDDFGIDQFDPDTTIAQNYVMKHENKLNSVERKFIEAMNATYYSFYNILDVEFEKHLVIKDIMLGTTHTIKERLGTHSLKRGGVIFSRILTLDNQSIFVGMAPFGLPSRYSIDLINFRKCLTEENNNNALNARSLRDEFATALHDYYFDVVVSSFNMPFPTLLNTDGEPFQISKTYLELSISPEEVLGKILPLTLSEDIDEFLNDAKRDKSGAIQQLELPWLKKGNKKHKNWDNTVMGQIIIKEGTLILEANSDKRTERGKKLLSKYLGDKIKFKITITESTEKKLQSLREEESEIDDSMDSELLKQPEVQEYIKSLGEAHWENWFDEHLPALDNKTPRECAKTDAGREILEALLLQFEHHNLEKESQDPFTPDIDYLKKELGLDSPS